MHDEQAGRNRGRDNAARRLRRQLASAALENRRLLRRNVELLTYSRGLERRIQVLETRDLSWRVRAACLESENADLKEQVAELEGHAVEMERRIRGLLERVTAWLVWGQVWREREG